MTVCFNPTRASGGNVTGAIIAVDALNLSGGYLSGGDWRVTWGVEAFAAYDANATITGPVTITWTWRRIAPTDAAVTWADSESGSGTAIVAGVARGTATASTTVTGSWSTLSQLHDRVVYVALTGTEASKVALDGAVLNVNTVSAPSAGTAPTVVVAAPDPVLAARPSVAGTGSQDVLTPVSVAWSYADVYGTAQAAYRVRVFEGTPADPDVDVPFYDSGDVTGDETTHTVADALANSTTWRAYVKVKNGKGTWSTWAYREFTFEAPLAVSVTSPTGSYSGASRAAVVTAVTLVADNPGLAAVEVAAFADNSAGQPGQQGDPLDPDNGWPDWQIHADVAYGPNLHEDPSFERQQTGEVVLLGGGSFAIATTTTRTGRRSLKYTAAGGATDGVAICATSDSDRALYHVAAGWVLAPAGVTYYFGWQMRSSDLVTVHDSANTTRVGTGTWQYVAYPFLEGGSGLGRACLQVYTATGSNVLYADDVELYAGTLADLTPPVPYEQAVTTTLWVRAQSRSGLWSAWSSSTVTGTYTGTPTVTVTSAAYDQANARVAFTLTRGSTYTGAARLELQRDDGEGYVAVYGSGSSLAAWTAAADGDACTVYDYACPPGTSPAYRARWVGQADADNPKQGAWAAVSPSGGPLTARWWVKDVVTPARNVAPSVLLGLSLRSGSDTQTWAPVSATRPTLASTTAYADSLTLRFHTSTATERTALETLRQSNRTLLVQSDFGEQWWVRTTGSRTVAPVVSRSRSSAPHDVVTWDCIVVDQPEAS